MTGDGVKCDPLTLIDAYSRFLLRCEAPRDPDTRHVRVVVDSAFQELGTPHAIRAGNGPPFASTGAGGLTELYVWWLGITPDSITPGKPQNGRTQRFHRTLAELASRARSPRPGSGPTISTTACGWWRWWRR